MKIEDLLNEETGFLSSVIVRFIEDAGWVGEEIPDDAADEIIGFVDSAIRVMREEWEYEQEVKE